MKRSPLVRKTPLKAKKNGVPRKAPGKAGKRSRGVLADMYASFYCKLAGKCLHCESSNQLEWCHLSSRRHRKIRWNPLNCVCMCRTCHRDFTNSPAAFIAWIEKMFPGRWQEIADIDRAEPMIDPDKWIDYYKSLGCKWVAKKLTLVND